MKNYLLLLLFCAMIMCQSVIVDSKDLHYEANSIVGNTWSLSYFTENSNTYLVPKNEKYTLRFPDSSQRVVLWDDCPEFTYTYKSDTLGFIQFTLFSITNISIPNKPESSISIKEKLLHSFHYTAIGDSLVIKYNNTTEIESGANVHEGTLFFYKKK